MNIAVYIFWGTYYAHCVGNKPRSKIAHSLCANLGNLVDIAIQFPKVFA